MRLYDLRNFESSAIREDPTLVAARSALAADSQNFKWFAHPIRHFRLISQYIQARLDAEERAR